MAEPAKAPARGEAQPASVEKKESAGPERPKPSPEKRRRALFAVFGIAAVILLAVVIYLLVTAGKETTDDAQIDADTVPLAPRVAGQVATVPVIENEAVKSGELVLQLDDREYRAKVEEASSEVDSARAQADSADAQVSIAEASARGSLSAAEAALLGSSRSVSGYRAQLDEARANLTSREADLKLAEVNLRRALDLKKASAIPQQQLDQAQTQYDSAKAAMSAAAATVKATEDALRRAEAQVSESQGRLVISRPVAANIAVARANAAYAHARLQSAGATLALAKLNLEWTRVVAPGDGVVSGITSHPGAFVAVGQTVAVFVPDQKYVTANFKETQVAKMRLGQRADLEVDTYGQTLHGRVESLSGGTGARFSLLPPDNATGNYVKIAQRIPVRIALENVPAGMTLRAGQSVEVTVHVND